MPSLIKSNWVIKLLFFVPLAAEVAPEPALPPIALAAAAPTIALTICAVPGSLIFLISPMIASLTPAPMAPEAKSAPVI